MNIQHSYNHEVKIELGPGSYIGDIDEVVSFVPNVKILVGRYTCIGRHLRVLIGGHDWHCPSMYPFEGYHTPTSKGDICIGSDVWIGENVTLLDGVVIPDGCVVGTGSVVRCRDIVYPYSIYHGNPCQLKRRRFDAITCNELMNIKWWDWPEDEIEKCISLLKGSVNSLLWYARIRNEGKKVENIGTETSDRRE